jgi:hypothetical protein
MVSCAVLPPRLPRGMAPSTGTAIAGAPASWDEVLNWQGNEAVEQQEPGRRKSFLRKAGLTTQRKRADDEDELPPFIMRQIPYETWRKHYAKDKDGNYRGTHAPAEDCLLKPEDVQKWRLGEAVTKADKWTRGREALPVYSEVHDEGTAPEYQLDAQSTNTEQLLTPEEGRLAEYFDATDPSGSARRNTFSPVAAPAIPNSNGVMLTVRGPSIADGKTASDIIGEAQARGAPKLSWRQKFSRGFQSASGSSAFATGV